MYSAVGVITPPALEPATLDQVRRHLRLDIDDDDDLLALYLTSARMMVEQFLGRALITQTLRWVSAFAPPTTQFPMFPFTAFILPLWMPFSLLFQRPIEFPRAPVQSVVSIVTGQWGQTDTTLDPTQYDLDVNTEPGRLKLLCGEDFYPVSDHLIVEFVAGYGDTPNAVPTPIILAVLMMTAFLYENRGDDGGEMPDVVTALLWPYRLYTFA